MSGPEPFFIAGAAGPLFALHFPAAGQTGRALLVLPPFAEELNKARRMLSLAARELQVAGHEVLLVDLHGTGDSAGDFADATLGRWRADIQSAIRWLADRGARRLDVLAVRGGALLLHELTLPPGLTPGHVVLWQPVISGRLLVAQFLRLRVAEDMGRTDGTKGSTNTRALLQSAGRIEVGGYEITRELVAELEAIVDPLSSPESWQSWHWFEVTAPGVAEPGPAAQRAIATLRHRGVQVNALAVAGEPFWATPEIAIASALLTATVSALAEVSA